MRWKMVSGDLAKKEDLKARIRSELSDKTLLKLLEFERRRAGVEDSDVESLLRHNVELDEDYYSPGMDGKYTNIIGEIMNELVDEAYLNDSLREAGVEPKSRWTIKYG